MKVSDPKALGPSTLPSDSFSERRYCIFYADDGGLLATNELNEPSADLYYLGIIDILTPYNYVKKIEHYWKSLSQDKVSVIILSFMLLPPLHTAKGFPVFTEIVERGTAY